MAAPVGCRLWGPVVLSFFGPLVGSGSAAESIRCGADPGRTAVVIGRRDTQRVGVPSQEASGDLQDKQFAARRGEAPSNSPPRDATPSGGPSSKQLVRDALNAEAAGNAAEREKLLRRALEKDPDDPPAHWHSGHVRVGKEWIAWEESQRRAAGDPRIAEYRRRFDEQAGTPAGELALARWCRDQGLDDQARFHWFRLLAADPQNEEALKALGVRWYQGQLLTHDEIVALRRGQRPQTADGTDPRTPRKDWAKHWAPRVTRWQRMVQENDPSLDSLLREEIDSVEKSFESDFWPAMQALSAAIMTRSQSKKDQAACRALSLKWVRVLDGRGEHPATLLLAWLAVDHPVPEVRAAAADALKKRPPESFVPILMARMQSPVEASFAIRPTFGSVAWECTFYREGPKADVSVTRLFSGGLGYGGPSLREATYPWGQDLARDQRVRDQRAVQGAGINRMAAVATARAAARATIAARQVEQAVVAANAAIQETNGRIREALTRATGTDCGESASAWWKWWEETQYDHFDLEKPAKRSTKKALYEYTSTTTAYTRITSGGDLDAGSHCYCFPRGTLVWTLTGPAAIDTVKTGDCVLSQHPITGELAFKPVVETTARRLRPLTKIHLGPETLTATRGHPFLVAGEGWKLAKDLKPGMRLHSPSGAVLVDGLEDVTDRKPFYERLTEEPEADVADDLAYNLVVDESHTYFVGSRRVLVFDDRFAAMANASPSLAASAK